MKRAPPYGTSVRGQPRAAAAPLRTALELRPGPAGARVFLDGEEVTREIRTPEVTAEIRHLARAAPVRSRVTALVRKLAAGRDVVAGEVPPSPGKGMAGRGGGDALVIERLWPPRSLGAGMEGVDPRLN